MTSLSSSKMLPVEKKHIDIIDDDNSGGIFDLLETSPTIDGGNATSEIIVDDMADAPDYLDTSYVGSAEEAKELQEYIGAYGGASDAYLAAYMGDYDPQDENKYDEDRVLYGADDDTTTTTTSDSGIFDSLVDTTTGGAADAADDDDIFKAFAESNSAASSIVTQNDLRAYANLI
jgi:hypothetical protein